ncbi:MAG: B12-binding domain-containing radical SAM protein [Proteobacteria bacterium]|nr:B12-binding domain-containing radical SAM protein [Pseudomonadota bacterium]MBU1593920.1 B12-binding domain-containing radical SAM protein [Pseudomonadota bacterium]
MPNAQEKILVLCPTCVGWPEWPLGMAYVLACLEQLGVPFDFIDLTTTKDWERVVVQRLRSTKYMAVAAGGLICFHRFFRRLRELARLHAPESPFILGGNIIKDANDDLLFNQLEIDYGVFGEAETSLPRFLEALKRGERDFTGYDGIFFRGADGQVVRNPCKRLDVGAVNTIPAWHHFDTDFYIAHSSFGHVGQHLRFMPVLSGRGCIGKCGFCSPTIGGFRKRPIPHVLDEIRYLVDTYDFDCLCFMNEMFYPTAREVREFCQAYVQLPVRKPWFVQMRIDAKLDVETLVMMREAGCMAISSGIESGSDVVLTRMNKKTNAADITEFFRNCLEAKLPAGGTFIVGYEGETEEDLRKTIDLMIQEDINSGEALLFVYQGTEVYSHAVARGLIKDEQAHLDSMCGELFAPDSRKRFINMTDMPTPQFFEVAAREVRRFNTHLFNTNRVRNITRSIERGTRWTHCELSGQCLHCGAALRKRFTLFGRSYLGFLGIGVNRTQMCPKCRRPIGWDVLPAAGMEDQQAHVRSLGEALNRHERIVVCGTNNDLDFLLRIDLLGLDYSRIVGIHPYEPSPHSLYLNYPVVDVEQIAALRPDCLLNLDPFQNMAGLLRGMRSHGAPAPAVLALPSPEFVKQLWREASLAARVFRVLRRCLGDGALDLLRFIRGRGQA